MTFEVSGRNCEENTGKTKGRRGEAEKTSETAENGKNTRFVVHARRT